MQAAPPDMVMRSRLRARSLRLLDFVLDEHVLSVPPLDGFRPILWHLAHIGVFEGYWLLQKGLGLPSRSASYDTYFDPIVTPREEITMLPTRETVVEFLDGTRAEVEASADRIDPFLLALVAEHERQHQETMAFLLQSIPPAKKHRVSPPDAGPGRPAVERERYFPARTLQIGAAMRGKPFAYDNEGPPFEVSLPPFVLDSDLTTNAEFATFVNDDGYQRKEFWSDDGWAWREAHAATMPLYWKRDPETGAYLERRFFSEGPFVPHAPVVHVSWYEAEAFARWSRKRLPTEFELEAAMREFPLDLYAQNVDFEYWGTTPVGGLSKAGAPMHDLGGNVWAWTSSVFEGYRGFAPDPYPEYSQLWFDGDHRVLRGASWATDRGLVRPTFRNFYRRGFRAAFSGVRLAQDP